MYQYEYQRGTDGLTIGRTFESVDEFVQHAAGGTYPVSRIKDGSWIGKSFTSWDQVNREAQTIQPREMEIVDGLVAKLMERIEAPMSRRKRRTWKEEGESVSFERVLERKDHIWSGHTKANRLAPRSVDIVFEFGGNSDVSTFDLMKKAAMAIALSESLEAAGYGVRLIAHRFCFNCWYSKTKANINSVDNIILKDEGRSLDKVAVVNAMTGWFYRTLAFKARTNLPAEVAGFDMGMGTTRTVINQDTQHVVEDLEASIIIKGSYDLAQIEREAMKRLTEMGIVSE